MRRLSGAAAVGCGDNYYREGLICPEISITGGNLTANGNIGYGERDTGYSGGKITIGSGAILKCTGSINPFEASTVPDNSYVNADGNLQQAQNVSSVWGKEDLTSGWWVVDKYTEVNNRIIITGTVNLILNDGVTLKASKGIQVYKGNTLNIYAQMNGTGKIEAYSGAHNSGIGGGYIKNKSGTNKDYSCGTINIYGGKAASGIGGGDGAPGGNITITGGNVTARHGDYARAGKGIGEGYNGSGGTVSLSWTNITDSIYATSYGGTVTLNSSFMLQDSNTEATTDNISGKTIVPPVSVSFNTNGGSGTMNSVKNSLRL